MDRQNNRLEDEIREMRSLRGGDNEPVLHVVRPISEDDINSITIIEASRHKQR